MTVKEYFLTYKKQKLYVLKTGIGFVLIKTNVEEETSFANILNFNYKFRDINQEGNMLNSYDNIRLQTGDLQM